MNTHQEGKMGEIFNNYGQVAMSPRRAPNVKGMAAEINLQKSYGDSMIIHHGVEYTPPSAEPQIKGAQAQSNYEMGQGHNVHQLFHEYGKLLQSARIQPKIKYGGVDNLIKGQGDAMRKAISQCPPSTRFIERPRSVQS